MHQVSERLPGDGNWLRVKKLVLPSGHALAFLERTRWQKFSVDLHFWRRLSSSSFPESWSRRMLPSTPFRPVYPSPGSFWSLVWMFRWIDYTSDGIGRFLVLFTCWYHTDKRWRRIRRVAALHRYFCRCWCGWYCAIDRNVIIHRIIEPLEAFKPFRYFFNNFFFLVCILCYTVSLRWYLLISPFAFIIV